MAGSGNFSTHLVHRNSQYCWRRLRMNLETHTKKLLGPARGRKRVRQSQQLAHWQMEHKGHLTRVVLSTTKGWVLLIMILSQAVTNHGSS